MNSVFPPSSCSFIPYCVILQRAWSPLTFCNSFKTIPIWFLAAFFKNSDLVEELDIKKAVSFGRYQAREMRAIAELHKYRSMRKRYDWHSLLKDCNFFVRRISDIISIARSSDFSTVHHIISYRIISYHIVSVKAIQEIETITSDTIQRVAIPSRTLRLTLQGIFEKEHSQKEYF